MISTISSLILGYHYIVNIHNIHKYAWSSRLLFCPFTQRTLATHDKVPIQSRSIHILVNIHIIQSVLRLFRALDSPQDDLVKIKLLLKPRPCEFLPMLPH